MELLHLLKGAESISSLRDRRTAASMAASAIVHLLQPLRLTWLRYHDENSLRLVSQIEADEEVAGTVSSLMSSDECTLVSLVEHYPEVSSALEQRAVRHRPIPNGHFRVIFPFFFPDNQVDSILLAECQQPPTVEQQDGIFSFLRFYANYLALLDYSELDTLTGLHNRKTFDDSLERLLGNEERRPRSGDQRQYLPSAPSWLAILDIDRFKEVNDTWGHLFGDETLLRFSRILKQSFRREDHLFRFGGEEFIVILRADSAEQALQALERFRQRLATTEFPQVGQVTCSVGFTQLDASLPAADILGRADEALYCAKNSGRNRIYHYETLLEQGRVAAHQRVEGRDTVGFDFDALFG